MVAATDAENNPLTFTAINAQIVTAENGSAIVSFTAPKMTTDVTTSVTIIVPDGQAEQASQLIRQVMESAHDGVLSLDVPLVAEAGIAKNWALAH